MGITKTKTRWKNLKILETCDQFLNITKWLQNIQKQVPKLTNQ